MRSQFVRRAGIGAVLAGALAIGTACWHTVITTDLPPSTQVHHEEWRPAFAWGLVPAQVDASKYCAGRRWARVETQLSPINWVVALVTVGIFTPVDVRVTCAASGAMLTPTDGPTLRLGSVATDHEKTEALAVAVELAKESGAAVYVTF